MFATLLEIQFDERLENIYVRKYFPVFLSDYMIYGDTIDQLVNNVLLVRENLVTVFWFKDCYKIKPRLSFYFSHNILGTRVCLSRDNLNKELCQVGTIYEANIRFVRYESSRNCCLYAGKLILNYNPYKTL